MSYRLHWWSLRRYSPFQGAQIICEICEICGLARLALSEARLYVLGYETSGLGRGLQADPTGLLDPITHVVQVLDGGLRGQLAPRPGMVYRPVLVEGPGHEHLRMAVAVGG